MAKTLELAIESAVQRLAIEGIDGRIDMDDWPVIRISATATGVAVNAADYVETILADDIHYRVIPTDGTTFLPLGKQTDQSEPATDFCFEYFAVLTPSGDSFAFVHKEDHGIDQGVLAIDIHEVPAYLLAKVADQSWL